LTSPFGGEIHPTNRESNDGRRTAHAGWGRKVRRCGRANDSTEGVPRFRTSATYRLSAETLTNIPRACRRGPVLGRNSDEGRQDSDCRSAAANGSGSTLEQANNSCAWPGGRWASAEG